MFRSEYERRQARRLIENGVRFEYENTQLSYLDIVHNGACLECGSVAIGKTRCYTPDFYFPETKVYVETKGKFDSLSRTKMRLVCEQSEEDIRLVFMRDNFCTRKHKMTYGRFCDLHNIQWAVGDIPLDWVRG